MNDVLEEARRVLNKYWGYADFRPSQIPILEAILSGADTLALLPTGGGKSLCFQVPGLVKGGTTLVISPLIALMKDQTERLRQLKIPAVALHSTLTAERLDFEMERIAAGHFAFVYVAPERLLNPRFQRAIQDCAVNLVAVDEAHCVSQWGYDFRPVYLQIQIVRDWWPSVQMAAFTATATEQVRRDICEKLGLRRPRVIVSSFRRSNLIYAVVPTEDKKAKLLELIRHTRRPVIVYTRNRRKTFEWAEYLRSQGVGATFYHAGLPGHLREQHQTQWLQGQVRVMVATNAFGMGIDKPDVQLVVHVDVPDNPEDYFQEAGRAGRDGRKAYAILLYGPQDPAELQARFAQAFPPQEVIRQVYTTLGRFLGLEPGSARGATFAIDLDGLLREINLPLNTVIASLKLLEKEGYIIWEDEGYIPAQIMFRTSYRHVYEYMLSHPAHQKVLEAILRAYPGVFEEYKTCRFVEVARRSGLSMVEVEKQIRRLSELGILSYEPATDKPRVTFLSPFHQPQDILFTREVYGFLKEMAQRRLQAMLDYLGNNYQCRGRQLLAYFGETDVSDCGDCDVCRTHEKLSFSSADIREAWAQLRKSLTPGVAYKPEVILASMQCAVNRRNLELLRSLVDAGYLRMIDKGLILAS
ncbi:MAG: RecQ family ATP-dependent DNA helicase [Flavobacteriales bacterium]|nr:RecQ family ATP-dependent DNA helicase [Flavobacteriales bacterium]MCX7767843.1 RecQ family ATP-dependent DNA helicase [Flavobacteriales bacterium]MDW8410659.1 ATP-dependent DNA helicase RecQ [Flavobacteriales bacterium]